MAVIALGIALVAGCGKSTTSVNVNANSQPVSVDVTTMQATVKPIPTYFEATGNLASDEATDVAPNIEIGKAHV